jgi:hypothetical protein
MREWDGVLRTVFKRLRRRTEGTVILPAPRHFLPVQLKILLPLLPAALFIAKIIHIMLK